MLLKQLQYKTRNRPVQTQVPTVYGKYSSTQQRESQVLNARNAHFNMGNKEEIYQPVSEAHEHLAQINTAPKVEIGEVKQQAEQMRLKARQTQFVLGTQPPGFQTSQNIAFTEDQFKNRNPHNVGQSNFLKQVHITVGSDKLNYETTNQKANQQQHFNEQSNLNLRKQEYKDRVLKTRQAQFSYGHHQTNYATTTNHTFTTCNEQAQSSAQAMKERIENGAGVRQAHFSLGHDASEQNQRAIQTQFTPVNSNVQASGTSVQIHHQGVAAGVRGHDRFVTSQQIASKQQMQPGKLSLDNQTHQKIVFGAQQKKHDEMKQAHFQLGNTQNIRDEKNANEHLHGSKSQVFSVNQAYQCGVPEINRADMKQKMQKVQFTMGDAKPTQSTTYSDSIDFSARANQQKQQMHPQPKGKDISDRHRRTNILMGTDGATDTTEAQKQFKMPDSGQQMESSGLLARLDQRKPNFSFAEQKLGKNVNNYFVSTSQDNNREISSADGSGCRSSKQVMTSQDIRAKVQEDRKTHFQVGYEPSKVYPIYNPHRGNVNQQRNSAVSQSQNNNWIGSDKRFDREASKNEFEKNMVRQKMCNVKLGNSGIGSHSAASFKPITIQPLTSNQAAFKWIQPTIE